MGNEFSTEVIAGAQSAQKVYPVVPASDTMAQWAIESNWGKAMPSGSNNPFGIKAVQGQAYVSAMTTEYLGGKRVSIPQKFAKYDSIAQAFLAHARLLATSKYYAAARAQKNTHDFVTEMAKKYATAPNYGEVINRIIDQYKLEQYDLKPGDVSEHIPVPTVSVAPKVAKPAAGAVVVAGSAAIVVHSWSGSGIVWLVLGAVVMVAVVIGLMTRKA